MPRVYDRQIAEEYLQLLQDHSKGITIRVLVLGPSTDSKCPGSKLRKHIASKCQKQRVVLFPERKSLYAQYAKTVGKYSDFCDYERKLGSFVDAVVIIPRSAGSLVELGLFALAPGIDHRKVLVLFSDEYPASDDNFINFGPRKSYDSRGALVKDVHYEDKKAVWDIVDDFLSKRKTLVFSRKDLKVS